MAPQPINRNDLTELTAESSPLSSLPPLQGVNPIQLQPHLSLQLESPRLSSPLPRPTLIARWEIENNKLVCHWVVDDRPHNSSGYS